MTKLTTRKSTSTKLTDTQLIVLSRAVQREDGAATLPPCLLWGAHCEKQTLTRGVASAAIDPRTGHSK
jgi:hypothetical protein